jgi:O-methyltransferase
MNAKLPISGRSREALARVARSGPARRVLGVRTATTRRMYLDLLERAVTHTLYFPPDKRDAPANVQESFEREFERAGITELGGLNDVQRRNEGRDWPVYAQTMIGRKRIRNLRECVETILADRVPGDLIEAGCWRGGAVIMMAGILKAYGVTNRTIWAADSFEGLPKPDAERFPADRADINYTADELKVPVEEVRANLARYGLKNEKVEFLEGWFRETLPTVHDRRWALVRLDGDLYESTMDGLVNLYPQLSPGGFLIVDDYGWENCRQAVEDYRAEHGISEPIERIDWVGAFWRKRA